MTNHGKNKDSIVSCLFKHLPNKLLIGFELSIFLRLIHSSDSLLGQFYTVLNFGSPSDLGIPKLDYERDVPGGDNNGDDNVSVDNNQTGPWTPTKTEPLESYRSRVHTHTIVRLYNFFPDAIIRFSHSLVPRVQPWIRLPRQIPLIDVRVEEIAKASPVPIINEIADR